MNYKNDYELIYLYKDERSEEAFETLVDKYRGLVWKNILLFGVKSRDYDDFYQESVIILLKAVHKFDEGYNKSFTRFYEMMLKQHFIKMMDRSEKLILIEHIETFCFAYHDNQRLDELSDLDLPKLEKKVFQLFYLEHYTLDAITEMLASDKKRISNALYRIKRKMKTYL